MRLRTDDPQFALSVTRLQRPFRSGRALSDRRITGFYRPLIERFQVNSVMALPLVIGDRGLGEHRTATGAAARRQRGKLTAERTNHGQIADV